MALAKNRTTQNSNHTNSIQPCSYFFEESSDQLSGLSSPGSYGAKSDCLGNNSSSNFVFRGINNYNHHQSDEAHSVINFKSGFDDNKLMENGESLLNFDQNTYQIWHQMNSKGSNENPRLLEEFNCFQTDSNYSSETGLMADGIQDESEIHEAAGFHKRLLRGENTQATKKQCTSTNRKIKPKSVQSKDPQSIAAKNRRERISERLKVLQELVPNGSKVDLVTMLEKAISYVKFLQLQVKVLATDEFWPVQGGKAPDISQVKEAIDAILLSQRDRNSSSNL